MFHLSQVPRVPRAKGIYVSPKARIFGFPPNRHLSLPASLPEGAQTKLIWSRNRHDPSVIIKSNNNLASTIPLVSSKTLGKKVVMAAAQPLPAEQDVDVVEQ